MFSIVLVTAINGMPTPEICFLPGQLRGTIFPKVRYGDYTQCRWMEHSTFQL